MGGPKQKGIVTYCEFNSMIWIHAHDIVLRLSLTMLNCQLTSRTIIPHPGPLPIEFTIIRSDAGLPCSAVSPYKQRPLAGVFQGYVFNGFSRIMAQVPYWILPVGLSKFNLSTFLLPIAS
jgi:hypothetical protein